MQAIMTCVTGVIARNSPEKSPGAAAEFQTLLDPLTYQGCATTDEEKYLDCHSARNKALTRLCEKIAVCL